MSPLIFGQQTYFASYKQHDEANRAQQETSSEEKDVSRPVGERCSGRPREGCTNDGRHQQDQSWLVRIRRDGGGLGACPAVQRLCDAGSSRLDWFDLHVCILHVHFHSQHVALTDNSNADIRFRAIESHAPWVEQMLRDAFTTMPALMLNQALGKSGGGSFTVPSVSENGEFSLS